MLMSNVEMRPQKSCVPKRVCFATHLMEAGVDIYTIKRWMGHGALVTTGRYMHVTAEHIAGVKSPLDTLYDEA